MKQYQRCLLPPQLSYCLCAESVFPGAKHTYSLLVNETHVALLDISTGTGFLGSLEPGSRCRCIGWCALENGPAELGRCLNRVLFLSHLTIIIIIFSLFCLPFFLVFLSSSSYIFVFSLYSSSHLNVFTSVSVSVSFSVRLRL